MEKAIQQKEAPKKEICLVCNKTVYFNEKVSVDSVSYHADCFRCYKCKTKINPLSYGKVEGYFFCKTHFEQKKKEVLYKIQYSGQGFEGKIPLEKKISTNDLKPKKIEPKVDKKLDTTTDSQNETSKSVEEHKEKKETPRVQEENTETPRKVEEEKVVQDNKKGEPEEPIKEEIKKEQNEEIIQGEIKQEQKDEIKEVKEEIKEEVKEEVREEIKPEIPLNEETKNEEKDEDPKDDSQMPISDFQDETIEEPVEDIFIDHSQYYKDIQTPLVEKRDDDTFNEKIQTVEEEHKEEENKEQIEKLKEQIEKVEEKEYVKDSNEEQIQKLEEQNEKKEEQNEKVEDQNVEKVEDQNVEKVEEKIEEPNVEIQEEVKQIEKVEENKIEEQIIEKPTEELKPIEKVEEKKDYNYEDLMNELFKYDFEPLFIILKSEKDKDKYIEGVINYLLKEKKEKELLRILEKSIQIEVNSTLEHGTLFRGNVTSTKLMKAYSSRIALPIYEKLLLPFIEKIIKNTKGFEIDPKKLPEGQDIMKNSQNVENLIQEFFDSVMDLPEYLPYTLRCYCKYLYDIVGERFKSTEESGYEIKHLAVGGFIFLRFISPILVNPEVTKMKFSQPLSNDVRRYLVIITKIIQNLSNGIIVANKEQFMDYFITLIKKNIPRFIKLFDELATIPEKRIEVEDQAPVSDITEHYYNIHRISLSNIEINKSQLQGLKEKESNSYDDLQKILSHLKPKEIAKQPTKDYLKSNGGKKIDLYQKLDNDNEFFEDFGFKRKKVEDKVPEKDKKDKKSDEKEEKQEKDLVKKKSSFSLGGLIKGVVSKNKKRLQEDGFDLDMSYITNQIIAMGYPSQGFQALVRNNMQDVIDYMEKKHKDQYMVYNLCAEKFYDSKSFKGRVDNFGFEDHNPPPLMIMRPLNMNIDNWLKGSKERVAAIHCKAGKGRTGTIIASYLLHTGQCKTAEEALKLFGDMRTKDGKGVTIPSQKRYVKYYETCLKKGFPKIDIPLIVKEIKWNQCPHFGVTPNLKITILGKEVFNLKENIELNHFEPKEEQVPITFKLRVPVKGDFKVIFTDKDEKYFHFWLNTNMIEGNKVLLKRDEIDSKGIKKLKFKRFQSDFEVVIKFDKAE